MSARAAAASLRTKMAPDRTEEELLAQLAKRDAQALSDLYDRFAPRLLGMLVSILPERNVAEETLEEVFLRLWNQARDLEQAGPSLSAWLVMNVRQTALARLRASRKGKLRPGAADSEQPSPHKSATLKSHASKSSRATPFELIPLDWIPRPNEIALLEQRLDLLHKVLNQLPKSQQEALDLAVFGGMTEEEIAQKLGEPLGRVRTALRAAVTFLRHRCRAVLGTWTANI
jgi:RNA polymerase sigma-70 factor, ECF subfamily